MNGVAEKIETGATGTIENYQAAIRQINAVFGIIGEGIPLTQSVALVKKQSHDLKDVTARLARSVYDETDMRLQRDMLEIENEQLRNQLRARVDLYGHS